MNLTQSIDYDLDMSSRRTMRASSTAEGGFKVWITDMPDDAYQEQKLHGTTEMYLVSSGTATKSKKK
jgi:hypothetical protein